MAATRQPGDMTSPVFDRENTLYESRAVRGAWYLAARHDRSGDEETSRLCFARLDQRTRKPAVPMKDAKVLHCALEWIEVDHPAFAAWWAKTPMSDAAVSARAQADRMIAGGQGSLVISQPFQAIPGRGTRAESLREVIYPTEFDTPYRATPPQVPAVEGKATTPAPPVPAGSIPSEGYESSYPGCSYETRNTGYSTECEISPAGGGLWMVRIVSEHVKDTGDIVMRRIKVNNEWIPDAKMPRFYSERITTSFRVEPGVPLLMAVMAPPDAAGMPDPAKRHLVFLTVNPEE